MSKRLVPIFGSCLPNAATAVSTDEKRPYRKSTDAFEYKAVVYRLLQVLLAAKVSLGCQHGNMAEKELNLLQFSAVHMAEFCAGSPEIAWSEMVQLHPLCTSSDDIPNDILANPL